MLLEFEETHVPMVRPPWFRHIDHVQATPVDVRSDLACPVSNQKELRIISRALGYQYEGRALHPQLPSIYHRLEILSFSAVDTIF
jgi:hypothetical protein